MSSSRKQLHIFGGCSNGESFMLSIYVRDGSVEWSISVAWSLIYYSRMCAHDRATPAGGFDLNRDTHSDAMIYVVKFQ